MLKAIITLVFGYIIWGLFPLYWSLLAHVPAFETLMHRVTWSLPWLALLVLFSSRRRSDVASLLHNKRELLWLCLTALLISINWGIYIWAVAQNRVLESSMGYFITPLLNVLAGVLIFGERLSKLQTTAIIITALGVLLYVFNAAIFPTAGLAVAISFAAYGVIRKFISTGPISGLFVEAMIIAPIALIFLGQLMASGEGVFLHLSDKTDLLLVLAGIVSVVPLLLFTTGAKALPMTVTGMLFYINPSIQFCLAVFIMNETLEPMKLISFAFIWAGIALYVSGQYFKQPH